MAKREPDPVLFRVLIEKTRNELDPAFIARVASRTERCVEDLLAVAGYQGRLASRLGQSGEDWHLTVRVDKWLLAQLDLFSARRVQPTVAQAATDVIDAALIAIARFRCEAAGVAAADLQATLKRLKSADPRVIAALARQPGRKLTVKRESGPQLELSVQSDSSRTVSAETVTLAGVIVAVGCADLFVLPRNRCSSQRLCLHAVRVKIPKAIRARFDPARVLDTHVRTGIPVELEVQPELVVRKRQHFTCLLVQWPAGAPLQGGTSLL